MDKLILLKNRNLKYLFLLLLSFFIEIIIFNQKSHSQIIPDNSLLQERSVIDDEVIKGIRSKKISGGAIRGSNLFHSFKDFNIESKLGAYFANPKGIKNIFSRVTGNNQSNLLGRLGVLGSANLFFINPNGVFFGPNSSLDISGSFFLSSAHSIEFDDGYSFSASKPSPPPLLTINVPIGLQIGNNSGAISIHSEALNPAGQVTGLELTSQESLIIIGNTINFQGGNISVPDGIVEIGSISESSFLGLKAQDKFFRPVYNVSTELGNINLFELSKIDASGLSGGEINFRSKNLTVTGGSQILSNTLGKGNGKGINIISTNSLLVDGTTKKNQFIPRLSSIGIFIPTKSSISTSTFDSGSAGSLVIQSKSLKLSNGASLESQTFGKGNAGNITVDSNNFIEISGAAKFPSNQSPILPPPPGLSENFLIEINAVSAITVSSGAEGKSGNIKIKTNQLNLEEGGIIVNSPFGKGTGGNIDISAKDRIGIFGATISKTVASQIVSSTLGPSNAGNINITTGKLLVTDGGSIGSGSTGTGNGGNIRIFAAEEIFLNQPTLVDGNSSDTTISAASIGEGQAGNLQIVAKKLILDGGAGISIDGLSIDSPGNLSISAESITLNNSSSISATSDTGKGGNIDIFAKNFLLLRNGSLISSTSGNETLQGSGGDISIDVAEGLTIASQFENSDITANAFRGNGGNISISSKVIIGLEIRDELTNFSDITSISSNSPKLNGSIDINIQGIDPVSNIQRISPEKLDSSSVLITECIGNSNKQEKLSNFVVTGNGGIPKTPFSSISPDSIISPWINFSSNKKAQLPSKNFATYTIDSRKNC